MSSDLEEYRQKQREKWNGNSSDAENILVTPRPEQATTTTTTTAESLDTLDLLKVHILPVGENVDESDRLVAATTFLSKKLDENSKVERGQVFTEGGKTYVVVGTEPVMGGKITRETDFFVTGPPVTELTRLQLVALVADGTANSSSSPSADDVSDKLFRENLAPYIEGLLTGNKTLLISGPNEIVHVGDVSYVATAMEPSCTDTTTSSEAATTSVAMISKDTLVYIDVDQAGEFDRVHVLPFQDTLPRVYDFDIFEDYLRPYFSMYPLNHYSVNTQFVFHGVQFKVVCVDPSSATRRIGPNTVIHCEGMLHASLRNILPPELLEQLSSLPPGLQMLLINTELLASADMLDRFIDLQETLAARRGVNEEILNSLPTENFLPPDNVQEERPENATQCMICLSDFVAGESLRRLPCAHVYHQPCIDEWLHRCTDCPLCKTNVEQAYIRNR